MSLSQISQLPQPPTRQDADSFDSRADAFLTALVQLQAELNTWTSQFNAESSAYNEKFFSRDSQLNALESEVEAGRGGYDDLASHISALENQIQNLVLSQNSISLSDIQIQRLRMPTPDDDGYAVGMMWLYDNDFWICTASNSGDAKWRRSNGDVVRRLVQPNISGNNNAGTFEEVTFTLGNLDSDAVSIVWEFTGEPVVVDGASSGSLQQSITVYWETSGDYSLRAKVVGNDTTQYTSKWSSTLSVLVGPSFYCGAGNYCGDGSYPGMMLS